ncbi:MAG TPA: TRAP transporter small permease [Pseudolabrys sp.]|nr:TRAP transporter small permease [Pseudolabrys sp.]
MTRWLSIVSRLMTGFGSYVVLPILTLLVTADVILRYVFNSPLSWGLEASRHLLLIFFLFGLLESFRVGEHVSMELISDKLSPAVTRLVSLLQIALIGLVFALILKKVIDELPFVYSLPQVTPELELRVWAFYVFIGFVCVLVLIYALHAAFQVATGRRIKVEEVDESAWTE